MGKAWIRERLKEYLFLPNGVCPVCGKILFHTTEFMCSRCQEDLPEVTRSCIYCGKPILSDTLDFCGDCGTQHDPLFSGGFCWLNYDKGGRRLVHAIKFGKKPQLGIWAGYQMVENLIECEWIEKITAIIAVPLHKSRAEERGFNQSEKLAEGIQSGLLNKGRVLPVLGYTLVRCLDTPHQIGLNREDRMINLSGAFGVTDPDAVSRQVILLIDDVNTTGTTLRECASELLKAGALSVYVATCTGAA